MSSPQQNEDEIVRNKIGTERADILQAAGLWEQVMAEYRASLARRQPTPTPPASDRREASPVHSDPEPERRFVIWQNPERRFVIWQNPERALVPYAGDNIPRRVPPAPRAPVVDLTGNDNNTTTTSTTTTTTTTTTAGRSTTTTRRVTTTTTTTNNGADEGNEDEILDIGPPQATVVPPQRATAAADTRAGRGLQRRQEVERLARERPDDPRAQSRLQAQIEKRKKKAEKSKRRKKEQRRGKKEAKEDSD